MKQLNKIGVVQESIKRRFGLNQEDLDNLGKEKVLAMCLGLLTEKIDELIINQNKMTKILNNSHHVEDRDK